MATIMGWRNLFGLVLLLAAFDCQLAVAQERPVDKDLRQLLGMLAGEFDNYNQIYFQTNGFIKNPEKTTYRRMHHIRKLVDSPHLEGHWLYTQAERGENPERLYRQSLWEFFIDSDGVIKSRVWSFRDADLKRRGEPDQAWLNQLKPESIVKTLPEGCLTTWKKQAAQFVGAIDAESCVIQSKYKDEKRKLFSEDIISADGFWSREGAYTLDGKLAFGLEQGDYYKYQRARQFRCWVAINLDPKKDEYAEDGQWEYYKDLLTHDIGGQFEVGKKRKYRVQLKQTRFPVGNYRDVMELFVFRGDAAKAFTYTWTNPDASLIGINTREVQGSCQLIGP